MGVVNPWRVVLSGVENANPSQVYVIVSNHQSLADIPVITHLRVDTKWLAKAELFRVPLFGWMLRMAGDVPVERGDARKAAKAMLRCARYLRQGCSVVFFPEGTRSPDGALLPFNEGPFQLAIREQAPILPLVLDGSGDALPRNSWLFGETQVIRLRILTPVPVAGWNVKQSAELRDEVRGIIAGELEKMRSGSVADYLTSKVPKARPKSRGSDAGRMTRSTVTAISTSGLPTSDAGKAKASSKLPATCRD